MEEKVVRGWDALAKQLGVSRTKALQFKEELQKDGAIFYMRSGRPPQRRMCFWPSEIVRWTRERSQKGEEM